MTSLKNSVTYLMSIYLGRRASRIRGEAIPLEVDIAWIVAAILLRMEDRIVVLQATMILQAI